MGSAREWWWRLRSLLGRRQIEDRLDDEIRFHVEQEIEQNRRAGMAPDEARRQALIDFGGVEQVRERTRDEFRSSPLEHLVRDVRYGLRSLRRHLAFTAMAVLSLAIGIGANAAIFGAARAMLFAGSRLVQPETLVNIYEQDEGRSANPLSYPDFEDLRKETSQVFSGFAASVFAFAPIDRNGSGTMVMGEAVSGGAFALLGVQPHLGRAIGPGDDVVRGGHPVVMLGYGYWERTFGADPNIAGRTMRMGGRAYTIIGVAPASYRGGTAVLVPAFFVPMAMANDLMGTNMLDQRRFHSFFVKARLAPGVTRAQAGHAASLVAERLTRVRPEGWVPGRGFSLVPTADVQVAPGFDPFLRAGVWVLMAVVGLVLLLACTNLASFLLARALDRQQEVAVRRALGATRAALVRQLLVESALLGLAGAAVGLVLALGLIRVLLAVDLPLPFGLRLDLHFGLHWTTLLDWRVLALTVGAGLVAGGLLGLVPAVHGTRADLSSTLKSGRGSDPPRALRWRNALVVGQIAMSLVLFVGAGLFLRSWQQMLDVDPGFGRAPATVLGLWMPVARSTPEAAVQRTTAVLDRLRAVPGVDAAALVWPLPLDFNSSGTEFTIDGHALPTGRESFRAERATVDGRFFDTVGITIVAGRSFNGGDRRGGQPVAIISQAMARRYWPDGDALGRMIRRPDPAEADLLVVGVASDINMRSVGEAPRDVIYEAYTQGERSPMFNFIVRASTPAAGNPSALLAAVREIDPNLQAVTSTTMAQHLAMSRLPSAMGAFMLSAFAVMAMALAAIGVYGLVRYTVARRSREIGIRMALGADAAGVARLLATQGVRLVLVGGAIGIAASLLVARFLATLLFGVDRFEPVALVGAPLVLVAAAWLAAYLPARRASRADPLSALRAE